MTGRDVEALALVLMLAAWTGLFAMALWQDPHAANDSALLLAKSTYADGNQYVPNLFIRRWSDGAPGLWARVAVWLAGLGALAWWLKRVAHAMRPGRGRRGSSPIATLATVAGLLLAAGLFLERWPGKREAPSFADRMVVPGVTPAPPSPDAPAVFVSGAARVREDEASLGPGSVELRPARATPVLEPEGHGGWPGKRPARHRPSAARPAPDRGAPRFAAHPLP